MPEFPTTPISQPTPFQRLETSAQAALIETAELILAAILAQRIAAAAAPQKWQQSVERS